MPPTAQVPGPYEDTTCQMARATTNTAVLNTIRRFRDTIAATEPGKHLIHQYYRYNNALPNTAYTGLIKTLVNATLVLPAYLIATIGNSLADS